MLSWVSLNYIVFQAKTAQLRHSEASLLEPPYFAAQPARVSSPRRRPRAVNGFGFGAPPVERPEDENGTGLQGLPVVRALVSA